MNRPGTKAPLSAAERAQIETLIAAGVPHAQIARELGRNRKTVIGVANKLKRDQAAEAELAEPELADPADRVGVARNRLWLVLNDPNSPGRDVVGAFNALAESEGWSRRDALELPEPKSDAERIERLVELIEAQSDKIREAVIARAARPDRGVAAQSDAEKHLLAGESRLP